MGDKTVEGRAQAELTDVRFEQEHWRFSVASGGGCELVPLLQAGTVVVGAVAALAFYATIRWARRLQFTEEGIWLGVWLVMLGLIAANLNPALLTNSAAFLAGIWGLGGIALVRQTVKTSFPTTPYVADGIAVVLLLSLLFVAWVGAEALPDGVFNRGAD